MKQPLNNFFLKDPSKWQFWMLLALFFKALIFVFLIAKHDFNTIPGFWGATGGDTESYLRPIDNFLAKSGYTPDNRMPGYGLIYLPFAFFFSKSAACNLIILLQFVASVLSVYPLALISKCLFKSSTLFYITFYLYTISTYTNLFDSILLTESFSTSFLILSVFFFIKALYINTKRLLHLFFSGLLLTETIFLRPVFFPLLLLFSVILIVYFIKSELKNVIIYSLFIFFMPFFVFEGLWITRNYAAYKKILPATPSILSPEIKGSYLEPLNTFVQSWGGNFVWWDPTAEIRWFGIQKKWQEGQPTTQNTSVKIPDNIYTSKFNYDSLIVLRDEISLYSSNGASTTPDTTESRVLLATIRNKCYLYANSIKQEKPFLYYIKAPLILTKKFLIHSGTYNLFSRPADKLSTPAYIINLFYSVLYLLILSAGAIGILLLRKNFKFQPPLLVSGIVIYTIIIHPIVLRFCEMRYFVPAYPFMLICAAYTINFIIIKAFTRRNPIDQC